MKVEERKFILEIINHETGDVTSSINGDSTVIKHHIRYILDNLKDNEGVIINHD
jgi:hypothetical protein